MRKNKFEAKIHKELLLLGKKEKLKYDEIEKYKKKIKQLESDIKEITKSKISKENELLTLEITKQHLTMQDVLKILRNEDILSIYKEQEKSKMGDSKSEE